VQIPDEQYQVLAGMAKAQQLTVSQVANKLIRDYLDEVDNGGDS
jgi:hypothetical protein